MAAPKKKNMVTHAFNNSKIEKVRQVTHACELNNTKNKENCELNGSNNATHAGKTLAESVFSPFTSPPVCYRTKNIFQKQPH
jgi:hypothetical protein